LLGEVGGFQAHLGDEFADGAFAGGEDFKDPNAGGMREGPEKLGLQLLDGLHL
jgi:hypothetical protein